MLELGGLKLAAVFRVLLALIYPLIFITRSAGSSGVLIVV